MKGSDTHEWMCVGVLVQLCICRCVHSPDCTHLVPLVYVCLLLGVFDVSLICILKASGGWGWGVGVGSLF